MEQEIQKYQRLLDAVHASEKPVVFVNACTHGHETVGVRVIEELQKLHIAHGTLLCNIANVRAMEQQVAFTESDLNRVFPGNPEGTYEERLAAYMQPVLSACDVVIDIHATETNSPGEDSMVIVTKLDADTQDAIESFSPPRTLVMEYTKSNALISGAKIGIGFEYGKNEHPDTKEYIVRDITSMLAFFGMVSVPTDHTVHPDTLYYRVFGVLPKEDGMVLESVENFTFIKEGQAIGTDKGSPMYAKQDFVPILFGNNRYKDIFGFLGENIPSHKESSRATRT